jgi:hypothetical protein
MAQLFGGLIGRRTLPSPDVAQQQIAGDLRSRRAQQVFTCLSLCDEEVYLAPAASACRASAGVGSVNGYPSPVDG